MKGKDERPNKEERKKERIDKESRLCERQGRWKTKSKSSTKANFLMERIQWKSYMKDKLD